MTKPCSLRGRNYLDLRSRILPHNELIQSVVLYQNKPVVLYIYGKNNDLNGIMEIEI